MSFTDLCGLDAQTIARMVKKKLVSPVETTQASIAAIEVLDNTLHAFCERDFANALDSAKALENRITKGDDPGPLAGVVIGIKDLILTKALQTTFGSMLYRNYVPDEDDISVARLRAADAIIIGKTNASEFGYGGIGHNPVFATTTNPWDIQRTPGGSSAGSAAAVAAGLCPLALGSDGGGSVRLPASFTGLVGFKPTMGRIPLWPGCRDDTLPGVSSWESIEHYGPLSRNVADSALFMSVVAGAHAYDRFSLPDEGVDWLDIAADRLPKELRIAWCPQWADLPVDEEVCNLCEMAVQAFAEQIGASVTKTRSPFGDTIEACRAIIAMETDLTGMRKLAAGREHELSDSVSALLSSRWTAEAFTDAITTRKAAVNGMARFMDNYDFLLTPTVPMTAFELNQDGPGQINGTPVDDDAWSPCLYPANWSGQPAVSVPAGLSAEGLPIGLQIIGHRLDDSGVLNIAALYESCFPDRFIGKNGLSPGCSVWRNKSG